MAEWILVEARPEQYLVSLKRQVVEWGGGLSEEDFISRERLLRSTSFGQALRCWALVPANDLSTLDFPCSVETYRRPVYLRTPSSPDPFLAVSYSIASVFTAPHHRKKGHARRMMTLLHAAIGLPSSPAIGSSSAVERVEEEWQGGADGTLSFLYSDVGDFYIRCGPPGWHIHTPTTTTWTLSSLPLLGLTPSPFCALISMSALHSLAAADAVLLASDLAKNGKATAFTVEPSGANYIWRIMRSAYHGSKMGIKTPSSWGAEIGSHLTPEDHSVVLWAIDYPKRILKVLRVRANAATVGELLKVAFQAARENGCEKVVVWNLEEGLEKAVEEFGGVREERTGELSAVAWYGEGAEGGKQLDWRHNEGYAWC